MICSNDEQFENNERFKQFKFVDNWTFVNDEHREKQLLPSDTTVSGRIICCNLSQLKKQ